MNYSNMYIGFDRDGTLELPDIEFNNKIAKQIKALQQAGAKIFLASGKGCWFLYHHFKQFDLTFNLICGENGGHIIGEQLDFIKKCDKNHLEFYCNNIAMLNLPDYEYEPKESIWTGLFFENATLAAQKIKDYIHMNKLDLHVYAHPDTVGGIDVVPKAIDKTNILDFIPIDSEIHFFGDGENDLSLMTHHRVIPHTITNAVPAVKQCVSNKNGSISTLRATDGVSELITSIFSL